MKVFYSLEEYYKFLTPHFKVDNYMCMIGNALASHEVGRKYIKNKDYLNASSCEFKHDDIPMNEKAVITYLHGLGLPGLPINKYTTFMLMTYPEIGLPVSWQKTILPDILSLDNYCSGLIAATHSPYIFDNNLDQYTHSLVEFEV